MQGGRPTWTFTEMQMCPHGSEGSWAATLVYLLVMRREIKDRVRLS